MWSTLLTSDKCSLVGIFCIISVGSMVVTASVFVNGIILFRLCGRRQYLSIWAGDNCIRAFLFWPRFFAEMGSWPYFYLQFNDIVPMHKNINGVIDDLV